jgi:hypothetical protein
MIREIVGYYLDGSIARLSTRLATILRGKKV